MVGQIDYLAARICLSDLFLCSTLQCIVVEKLNWGLIAKNCPVAFIILPTDKHNAHAVLYIGFLLWCFSALYSSVQLSVKAFKLMKYIMDLYLEVLTRATTVLPQL